MKKNMGRVRSTRFDDEPPLQSLSLACPPFSETLPPLWQDQRGGIPDAPALQTADSPTAYDTPTRVNKIRSHHVLKRIGSRNAQA